MANNKALEEFSKARFGMFIHWGIYSLLESGEWVMYARRIPVKEYEKLAPQFNPTEFDAEKWVQTAKAAGMKYIVITAKHHDGFSMFSTKVSPFNIVDATPFGRDPMKELAEACRRNGLKLGFYYSHVREWRHPMAQSFEIQGRPDRLGNYGNFWDYPDENRKDLQKYIDEFDMPQLKELLTQYGDILTIWFDTPSMILPRQAEQLRDLVHSIQPDCLVNGRISNEIETDYKTMGDCEVPACGADKPWDTPMTSSRSWGYSANDSYRTAGEFIRELCDIASKGGNYLLNVGPDSHGVIPEKAAKELAKVGNWLSVNGEAVFGTQPGGFRYRPKWGCVTKNGDRLYAIIFDENALSVRMSGLKSRVKSCEMLGGDSVDFEQTGEGDASMLTVSMGAASDRVRVIKICCDGDVDVTDMLMPGDDDSIELNCIDAKINVVSPYSKLILENGATHRWLDASDSVEWSFITTVPDADYEVHLVLEAGAFWSLEDFGHEVSLVIDGEERFCVITEEAAGAKIRGRRYMNIGDVHLKEAGKHRIVFQPEKISCSNLLGITLFGVELVKK